MSDLVRTRAVSFKKAQIAALYFSVDNLKEKQIVLEQNCTQFNDLFSKVEYVFGEDNNTTFYIHVYDFEHPLWIKVINVNIKSCFVLLSKNKFIFVKSIFELGTILFHHNLLFFEIVPWKMKKKGCNFVQNCDSQA